MGINLFAYRPGAYTAKQTISFVNCGFDTSNIVVIIETGEQLGAYDPALPPNFQQITGFTKGNGYYIIPKINMDRSEVLASPVESGFYAVAPISLNQSDYSSCVYLNPLGTNSRIINPFCHNEFDTDASGIVVTCVTQLVGRYQNQGLAGANGISLFINGNYQQRVVPTANDALQEVTLNLSSYSGIKRVKLAASTNDSGWCALPVKVQFPDFAFFNPVTKYRKPFQLVSITDSIGVGVGCTIPEQYGYVPLLRGTKEGWDITPIGYGGAKFSDFFGGSYLSVTRGRVKMRLNGAVKQRVLIACGTNDDTAGVSTSAIQGYLLAGLDAIHADFPDAKIWVQTPTSRTQETSNTTAVRNAIASAAASRSDFTTLINGPGMVSISKSVDGVHPNDAGNADMATAFAATTIFD